MARRKAKREEEDWDEEDEDQGDAWLRPETKKTILAIFFIVAAILLVLSLFGKAGPAGDMIYRFFNWLLGLGYFLLPLAFLFAAAVFLIAERKKILITTIIGGILLVLSGLGFIDIISPDKGGVLGSLVGSIEIPFGYTASIVLTVALFLASGIIMLNTHIVLKNPLKRPLRKKTDIEALNLPDEAEENDAEEAEEEESDEDEREQEDESEEEKELMVTEGDMRPEGKRKAFTLPKVSKDYTPPTLDLLVSSVEKPTSGDLRANANIIKRTLESFGIPVEMSEVNIGPKVTRYSLKPAEGVKLAKITALKQDLSLALAAHPIRIEAPIPGKSLVGIEVPNKSAAIVRLGSLMIYPEFASSGQLGFILGRDVTGNPIFADISKMPHLLIAGATGSGKSVALHALIVSLLYKNGPQTLRFVMIDPKRVELSIYNGIPHLVSPVVMDGKKTMGVFRWAIKEMENRYEVLQMSGNKDIKSYNAAHRSDPLPFIVIIVDELADLMAAHGREIEGSIVRLAQMARAVGIHLILATQRPSVEVITGLIKANITSRMALQVASQVDSRTILDGSGAESLLGGGDMLFVSSDFSKPKRIQGAYLSEEEMNAVADFIRSHNEAPVTEDSENSVLSALDGAEVEARGNSKEIFDEFADAGDGDDDEIVEQATNLIRETKKASASFLQRHLKIGYARAARVLDILEKEGKIGPGRGAKEREVFL